MKKLLATLGVVILVCVGLSAFYYVGFQSNWFGKLIPAGEIEGAALPPEVIADRVERQQSAARDLGADDSKQILFGDLHVHTVFSTDAFFISLPMVGGDGAHPISDACDFARFCAGLDFWSINDHAEASTPRTWAETRNSIRQCNAIAGEGKDPDVVPFMGFEWTQVGTLPENHYGHKNVVFKGIGDGEFSARAIGSKPPPGGATVRTAVGSLPPVLPLLDFANRGRYFDFKKFQDELRSVPDCDPATPSNELPDDCYESASTPAELATRLEAQDLDHIIIPHGGSWGFYTPPGTTLDKQLKPDMRPEVQEILEVHSGHGNSEEYRPWRAVTLVDGEDPVCPQPSEGYLPSCWRAGVIIKQRCLDEGESEAECDARAEKARADYAAMGVAGHLSVTGETAADWLNAGQCQDCFMPSFNYRPGNSAQYGLALTNFDSPNNPRRFKWGFISSSDNHFARPGTGYKEYMRNTGGTEAVGAASEQWASRILGGADGGAEKPSRSQFLDAEAQADMPGFARLETERNSSFFQTGGMAAVHADGRDREAIWAAMKRHETYATSGPHMLLWFDLLNSSDGMKPMGSEVDMGETPQFRVRAVGAFKQKPGCPETIDGLTPERAQWLCQGECYNPSDDRHPITRIEIIRIRPQMTEGEPVEDLIEDPWLTHQCAGDATGCSFQFTDDEFVGDSRDAVYYARAVQEATPTVNAMNLRCEYDSEGNCVKVNPCYGDYRTSADDNCLAPAEHRAWSSPIYVDHVVVERLPAPATEPEDGALPDPEEG